MQITMEGKYRTRDGRPVRILAIIRSENWPVVGVITNADGTETAEAWTKDGDCLIMHDNNGLISIPTKHEGWCIVETTRPFFYTNLFLTKEEALRHTSYATEPIALAHVTWED